MHWFTPSTCGGTALNRMFESAEETSARRVYRFVSRKGLEGTKAALKEAFSAQGQAELNESAAGVRANFQTSSGIVAIRASIRIMSDEPEMHLVEMLRVRGDLLTFINLATNLSQALKTQLK